MDYEKEAVEQSEMLLNRVLKVEEIVNKISEKPLEQLAEQLSATDQAKFCIIRIYAIYSLLYNYCQISGLSNSDSQPILEELKRVKAYFGKLESFIMSEQGIPPPKSDLRSLKVDPQASKRVVSHYVNAPIKRASLPTNLLSLESEDFSPSKKEKVEKD